MFVQKHQHFELNKKLCFGVCKVICMISAHFSDVKFMDPCECQPLQFVKSHLPPVNGARAQPNHRKQIGRGHFNDRLVATTTTHHYGHLCHTVHIIAEKILRGRLKLGRLRNIHRLV